MKWVDNFIYEKKFEEKDHMVKFLYNGGLFECNMKSTNTIDDVIYILKFEAGIRSIVKIKFWAKKNMLEIIQ
jgi:hypothetical protein